MHTAFSHAGVPFKLALKLMHCPRMNSAFYMRNWDPSFVCFMEVTCYRVCFVTWLIPHTFLSVALQSCCAVIAGPRQGFVHLQGTKLMTKRPKAEVDSPCVSGVLWQGTQNDVTVCSEEYTASLKGQGLVRSETWTFPRWWICANPHWLLL